MTGRLRPVGRVLVTGALGFLGATLVKSLEAEGTEVVATDTVSSDGSCLRCNVTAFDQVSECVAAAGIETIMHCGAVSGPMMRAGEPLAVWRINVEGTANILEAARLHRVGRVVVCSTTEVYGDCGGRVDETTPPKPASVYAASKLAAEHAMLAWAAGHGVDALALRLSWIYGPGRRTPTTLETLILNSLRGRTTVIDGRPSDPTHYIHVEDAVDALVSAAMTNSVRQRIYNATGGAAVALERVVAIVRRTLPAAQVEYAPDHPRAAGPDEIAIDRIAADLGYAPRMDLEAGIAGYIQASAAAARS